MLFEFHLNLDFRVEQEKMSKKREIEKFNEKLNKNNEVWSY